MFSKCVISILFGFLLYQETRLQVGPVQASFGEPDLRCGSMCVYIGMKSLGTPIASFNEVESRFSPAGPLGYSMDQMRIVAETFGIRAAPVVTNLDNLGRRQRPFACIAHLKSGHFVLIGDITDKSVFVVNPPYVADELPIATFLSQWDNNALILSTHEILPEETLTRRFSRWQLIAVVGTALVLIIVFVSVRLVAKSRSGRSS